MFDCYSTLFDAIRRYVWLLFDNLTMFFDAIRRYSEKKRDITT